LDESEIAYAKPLLSMFNPKATSQVLTAAEAAVGYKGKTMGLSLRYKRVILIIKAWGLIILKVMWRILPLLHMLNFLNEG
jgi:hypothetical protein